MTDAMPDGVYHATFGAGALLAQGALVLRHGKAGGIGHEQGEYAGSYHYDPSDGRLALDIDIRVPTAAPIAAGLKAGPAGSTVRVEAAGRLQDPLTIIPVDLMGHKGEMALRRVGSLPAPPAAQQSGPLGAASHPDAFPDGIYRVEAAGIGYLTRTIIVLAGGRMIGVGEMGGSYFATYEFDPVRKLTAFTGHAKLPPNVPLVTGGFAGPDGLTVPMSSETKFTGGRSRFSFSMAGRAIDASLVYQRPLPG